MTNKNFGKINIKIVTYINVPLCKISVNLKIMGPNFLKKHMNEKNFGKINMKIVISI